MTPTPHIAEHDFTLYLGDVRAVLVELPDRHVDCIVTSPPYWGLRDYGTGEWAGGDPGCDHIAPARSHAGEGLAAWSAEHARGGGHVAQVAKVAQYRDVCGKCGATRTDRQLGLEAAADCLGWATGDCCGACYVCELTAIMAECRRVLSDHGTLWLNLGDSYSGGASSRNLGRGDGRDFTGGGGNREGSGNPGAQGAARMSSGVKRKELVGVPWRVAFALQADGWYLRSDVIWSKPNAMPASVTDRPTSAHEYFFLLAKRPRYYYDQDAIREPHKPDGRRVTTRTVADGSHPNYQEFGHEEGRERWPGAGRNVRTVWEIATRPYPDAHFATYPDELVQRAIAAGCPREVCRICGKPRERMAGVRVLDLSRPQSRRALELAEDAGLTDDHIEAIRAVGIADVGKALVTTTGAGRSDPEKVALADEAKAALGGYYREFLLARPSHGGWSDCECAYGLEPGDLELISTPTGNGNGSDPTLEVGRAGLSRPRAPDEGVRPITRYEQRTYAAQIKASPHSDAMQEQAGPAFAHYVRTDRSGARPVPPDLLAGWLEAGWLEPVELPEPQPGTYRPGIVLDPFLGSGTTAVVARRERRHAIGVELNPDYVPLIRKRIDNWHRRPTATPTPPDDQLTLISE